MSVFLKRGISSVYVITGEACGMSCRYCLQRGHTESAGERETDPAVYDFIRELAREEPRLRVVFYGGEPLLYFPVIRDTVAACGELNYSVITNGRELTDEAAEFFNGHNFGVAVSWDGAASSYTRGFDVFSVPRIKKRILSLNGLCLTGVISAAAYPARLLEDFGRVSEEYEALRGRPPSVNLDEIMDTGIADRTLLDVDCGRVRREIREQTLGYLENLLRGRNGGVPDRYIGGVTARMQRFFAAGGIPPDIFGSPCGSGLSMLNMDTRGNLYICHNSGVKAGDIRSAFYPYMRNILAEDRAADCRAECLSCSALPACRGGCRLVSAKARKEGYCDLKRAVYGTVLETIKENGPRIMEHGE